MLRKSLITILAFLIVGLIVFGVSVAVDPNVGTPVEITASTPCPATGCASGVCHGYADVPIPDGVTEMVCPEVGCASVECHAWETLSTRYHQASDASLNLWVLAPVALVVALVLLVKKVR